MVVSIPGNASIKAFQFLSQPHPNFLRDGVARARHCHTISHFLDGRIATAPRNLDGSASQSFLSMSCLDHRSICFGSTLNSFKHSSLLQWVGFSAILGCDGEYF